jgi:hypothetical protein
MGDVVEMNSEGFFASLVGLEADEALARCKLRADEWRDDIAHLQEKLGQTPRADKQGAHAIKQAILRTQSKLQRLKPVVASYRATLEKRETHSLWVECVKLDGKWWDAHEVFEPARRGHKGAEDMNDRELLEAAAKAAGHEPIQWHSQLGWLCETHDMHPRYYWNPLTDDGDAFRLAVKLNLIVRTGSVWVSQYGPIFGQDVLPDPYAATRRAIVRAAAAMATKGTT